MGTMIGTLAAFEDSLSSKYAVLSLVPELRYLFQLSNVS
jgi:hypothetical protein